MIVSTAIVSSVRVEGDLVIVQREAGPLNSTLRRLELAGPNGGTPPATRMLWCAKA